MQVVLPWRYVAEMGPKIKKFFSKNGKTRWGHKQKVLGKRKFSLSVFLKRSLLWDERLVDAGGDPGMQH